MKIRVFFDKKNFLDIKVTTFTYTKNEFWYLDDRMVSHTIKNVVGITSI
ncbi:MAG: hypothetical protein MJ237_08630 [bacterium]|nr:hypothetical protein [bacterium]